MRGTHRPFSLTLTLALLASFSQAQDSTKKPQKQTVTAAASNPVVGSGSTGQITKWTGVDGSNSFSIGNSNIFEDKFGKVGIGTKTPTSSLTVQGMIETTLGGYKFPDGTVQTTAGIAFVTHDPSLSGLGTPVSPLGIALGGVQTTHLANGAVTAPKIANGTVLRGLNGLFDNVSLTAGSNITIVPSANTLTIASPNSLQSVSHDLTLNGAGTPASPLTVTEALVVTRLNFLTGRVTLTAGPNITIAETAGNALTISAENETVAYRAKLSGAGITRLDVPGQDVISKTVPAGSYLIFFKTVMFNMDDDSQTVECVLNTGDSSERIRIEEFGNKLMVIHGAGTFPVETTLIVHCTGFHMIPANLVLTALRVESIQ